MSQKVDLSGQLDLHVVHRQHHCSVRYCAVHAAAWSILSEPGAPGDLQVTLVWPSHS